MIASMAIATGDLFELFRSLQSAVISVVVPIYKEEHNVVRSASGLRGSSPRSDTRGSSCLLGPSPDRTYEDILRLIDEDYPIV